MHNIAYEALKPRTKKQVFIASFIILFLAVLVPITAVLNDQAVKQRQISVNRNENLNLIQLNIIGNLYLSRCRY